jgi:hypothetical protein
MTVDELCERHRRVAFDVNVFIYLFESSGPLAQAAIAVVNAVSAGRLVGVVSSVALTEVVVRPVQMGDDTTGERYVDSIRSIENLHVVPATIEIAVEAGFVRGRPHVGRRPARRDCACRGGLGPGHQRPEGSVHAEARGGPVGRPRRLTVRRANGQIRTRSAHPDQPRPRDPGRQDVHDDPRRSCRPGGPRTRSP